MNILIPNVTYITGFPVARALKSARHNIYGTLTPFLRPAFLRNQVFNRLLYEKMMFLFDGIFEISAPASPDEEAAYIDKILKFCRQKKIDAIFPVSDKEIVIFARHREIYEKLNIAVAANNHQVLDTAFNKYEVSAIADEIGYPCPRTVKCASTEEAIEAAAKMSFPLILKPYVSGGGSYDVMFIRNQEQLLKEFREKSRKINNLILQEYIQGNKERSLNIVLDSEKQVRLAFTLRKMRHIKPSLSTAVEVVENPSEMDKAVELVQRLGIVGFCAVQTKLDERDNKYKLIEVNPRLGSNLRILTRFGNNLPLMCFNLLLKQDLPQIKSYRVGTKGCAPFDDFLAFFVFLYIKIKNPRDDQPEAVSNHPPSITEMVNSYVNTYKDKPVIDDYAASIFNDPVSTLRFYCWLFKAIRALPEHFDEFIPWGDI
jgi:glutathione synthase/RimK-type ligase-like ATP-grasp enzyme